MVSSFFRTRKKIYWAQPIMWRKKRPGGRVLLWLPLFVFISCKKSPTPVSVDLGANAILVACSPDAGRSETLVTIAIIISNNSQEIRAFGLELTYDSRVFQFQRVASGNLTGNWSAVDGNQASPGTLKIGGFAGGGSSIAKNSQGALALVQVKVTGPYAPSSQQSQICLDRYADDLISFQPAPSCTFFTLKK